MITWAKDSGAQYQKTYQGIQAVEWEREDFSRFILAYNLTDEPITATVKESQMIFEPHKLEMLETPIYHK